MSLINIDRAELSQILKEMELAQFQFYLTGSRFFGHDKPGSDWDFFVESESGLTDWLTAYGFLKERNREYLSKGIIEVWKHWSQPIHVQIVESAREKDTVQKVFCEAGYAVEIHRMCREQQKVIWSVAIDLFRVTEEQAMEASRPTDVTTS